MRSRPKKKKEKRFSSFSLEGEKTNHTTKEEEERSFAQKFCLLYSIHFAFVCFLSHRRRRRRQMEEFNDPRFDPINYVNVAARQCFNNDEKKKKHLQHKANDITDENVELERLLSELEMRLQLLGEDISLQLERESQLGVKRIPTAIGEIEVLEENVESLTNTVKNISR